MDLKLHNTVSIFVIITYVPCGENARCTHFLASQKQNETAATGFSVVQTVFLTIYCSLYTLSPNRLFILSAMKLDFQL